MYSIVRLDFYVSTKSLERGLKEAATVLLCTHFPITIELGLL